MGQFDDKQDVEGHRALRRNERISDDTDDVEGHKLIRKNLKADEDDVEGHRFFKNRIGGE